MGRAFGWAGAPLRRPGAAAWLILLVALVLRAVVVAATPDYLPINDPADYDKHAESIAAGNGYPESGVAQGGPSAFRPPGYPYFLGAVYTVSGDSWTAGRLAQALLGTIGVALLGVVAWQIWGRRTALVTMSLGAVAPPLLVPVAALLSEPLFIALELGAVAAVLEHRKSSHRLRWVLLAGALAGLAMLVRTNGVFMLPALAFGVWTARPRISWSAVAQPVALALAAALVIAPWTVRNAVVMDHFVPVSTQFGIALAVTYNDAARLDPENPSAPHYDSEYTHLVYRTDLDEVELEAELGDRARQYMLDHKWYVVQTAWRNTARSLHLDGFEGGRFSAAAVSIPRWLADLGIVGFYALAALALAGAFLPAARRAPLFVWAVPLLLFASAAAISGKTRYRVTLDPFVIMLAGLAVVELWNRFGARAATQPRIEAQ